jgi:hypothetical protein
LTHFFYFSYTISFLKFTIYDRVKYSHNITVTTTDNAGIGFTKDFTIVINDVNETPTDIQLTNSNVNENSQSSTVIGSLNTIDPDTGNTFTYSLVTGIGDTDNALFSIVGNQLQANAVFDYETKNSYSIRVRTTDQGGLSYEKQLTIGVTNVNESPINLNISNSSIAENQSIATTIGTLTSIDPDISNTFTYNLVVGAGDTDNGLFSIVGNQLKTNAVFDYETKNSYSIRVRTTDQSGLFFEKELTISIANVNEGSLSFSSPQFSISEDGSFINIVTVTRLNGSDGAVSATINLTNGTATADSDYNNTPITVNFANGENSKTVTIPIINDTRFESDETVNLILSNPQGGATLGTQTTATLTIINDDLLQPGVISLNSSSYTVNENGTPTINLIRTGGSDGEVTVTLTLSNGTATAGSDYNNLPITVTFTDGETSKTVVIPIIDDSVYETTETVNLTLSNPTDGATLGTQQNAVLNILDNDAKPGIIQFSDTAYSINENGTPVTTVTLTRTEGSDGEITVRIDLSDITTTASSDYYSNSIIVNFADGKTTKTVTIPIIDDSNLENTETLKLTLANPTNGATIGTQKSTTVSIIDNDFKPTLTVNINADQITEGHSIQGTVTRNTDTTTTLTVTLLNSDNSQLTIPTTVTIPIGSNSANFSITAVDDTLIELPKNYTVIATAQGFISGSDTLAILDNDAVTLSLSIDTNNISENGGKVLATVTRNIVTDTPLLVQLSSSDTTEAIVPTSVIIAANQSSATFEIQGIDDTILDGTQSIVITAKSTYTGTNLTVDLGQATANLNVTDNESPSLSLILDKNIISETGTATATIIRNTDTTEALTINFASSDSTEATVPQTVTILPGQTSATFIVSGVNDGVSDGIQSVTLTASANGFNNGVKTVEVSDIDVPDLQITNLATTTNPIYTGKQSYLSYKVENKGLSPASGSWTDKIYLSADNQLDSSDTLITETTFSPDIPFNSFYERNVPFFAPTTTGQYYLIATTDANNTVNEGTGLGEQNNAVVIPITVTPAYRATVSTDTVIGTNGQAVTLRGSAVNNADNSPVAFEFVTIKLENNGTIRELSAFTDGDGNFVKSFNPLPTEGGQYNINAYFPSNPNEDTAPEDSFKLLGMRFNSNQVSHKVLANTPFTASIELQNITDIGITGITATVDSVVNGWNVQVNTPSVLNGSGNNTLTYTITAPNDSYITQDTFNIKLTSTEGVTAFLPVNVNLERIVSRLVASTNLVNSGMLRGDQTFVEFDVTNEGGAIAENIEVELPNFSWLKLVSPTTISALNPGESSKITLLLSPDSSLPLTEYTGNFFLDAEGNDGDLSVNFNFRAVSNAEGNIKINTVDELFYFAEGAPKLANATVTLRDYFTNTVIANVLTDETGLINLSGIKEGYYNLEIKADKHDTFRQTIQLDAGETENINAFLSRQTVQYIWNVTPTEIEDKYDITVESVFETNVPIPTIVVDPPLIDLESLQVVGQVMQIDMTLTNHGLIAANDVQFGFSDHPFYKIEPLINNIESLGAKSSITVPVRITRIADENTVLNSSGELSLQSSGELVALSSGGGCGISLGLDYNYECAGQTIKRAIPIPVLNVSGNGSCGIGGGSWNPQGGSSGGSSVSVSVSVTSPDCDPCKEQNLQASICVLIGLAGCIPGPIGCGVTVFSCAVGFGDGEGDWQDWTGCLTGLGGCVYPPLCIPSILLCLDDFCYDPILGGSSLSTSASLSPINQGLARVAEYRNRVQSIYNTYLDFFGDEVWLNVSSEYETLLVGWLYFKRS